MNLTTLLEKPKTNKVTSSGVGYGIRYAVSAMQGWRMEMEGSHICATDFIKNWSFFGVFDGHAGPKVSQYCSEHILDVMLDDLLASLDAECKSSKEPIQRIPQAIYDGFLKLDDKIKREPMWANGGDHSGTMAITVMISPTHIYWANCGDSRGFLCSDGKVAFATQDHKPYLPREKERIEKAGGSVIMQRVNGSLAVSRALGDFDYKRNNSVPAKEQLVSPEPEIDILPRNSENDEFLLLACDGIYDVMSNEEVMSYVRRQLELTANLEKICNDLIDLCLNKNSRDNMSVVLVVFPNAPKVSQEAIEQEKKLQKEEQQIISKKLEENNLKVSHKEISLTKTELGRGGWGVIWIGKFRGQRVAIKQMHELIKSDENIELLHREINTMSQLRHPNLLQFIGAVLDHPSGDPMIITEVMDTSLRSAYERKELTPDPGYRPVILSIMRDVAVGLNYLHCLPDPIIHRDVSSANVLLQSKGPGKWKTKVSDFGSANLARAAITEAPGALVYSAPESVAALYRKKRKQTPKMDSYSYGVLLCEVLRCRFPDVDIFEALLKQVKAISSHLHELIVLCINEEPDKRPTMSAIIIQLDRFIA